MTIEEMTEYIKTYNQFKACVESIESNILAFGHDLPRLLKTHKGEYAVYRDGKALGFWSTEESGRTEMKKYPGERVLMFEVKEGRIDSFSFN